MRRRILNIDPRTTRIYSHPNEVIIAKCDCTNGNVSLTMPDARGVENTELKVVKTDATANTVTLAGINNQTINGSITLVISGQWSAAAIESDGQNWIASLSDKHALFA